jgi:hypothetical protein
MDDLSLLYYSISLIFFIKTLFEFLGIKVSKKIIISVIPMVLLCLILYFSQKIENSPRAIYEKN